MTTSNYHISNDVDPNVPKSFPVSGVVAGVDTSGLLAPVTLSLEAGLIVVSQGVLTPKKAALNSTVYLVSNKTAGFAPKVSPISDGLYLVDVAGAYTDAQLAAVLADRLRLAGNARGGAGGPIDAVSAATSATPTATAGAAPTLTPLVVHV